MATVETFQLRGKNYDDAVRQLVSTYNVSNGWAVLRVINRLTSLDVILERNSEQGVSADTSKDTVKATPTEKVVDADATASDELPSATDKPVAVKTTRKSKLVG